MCGRFSLFAPREDVEDRFDATFKGPYEPRYNAAPGQSLHVIRDVAPGQITTAEWGLQPAWAEQRSDGGFINARAETVAEKRSFRPSIEGPTTPDGGGNSTGSDSERDAGQSVPAAGRCLVPADGFYEWAEDEGRQPYRIERPDRELFAMAGLWTRWTPARRQTGLAEFGQGDTAEFAQRGDVEFAQRGDVEGQDTPTEETEPSATVIETFAIITTAPNEVARRVHDRMPVVLAPEEESTWLGADPASATDLLDPYERPLELFAISSDVNDPSNDHPGVLTPLEG